MKNIKVRMLLILVIVAILAVSGISGVLAFMFRESPDYTNTFVPADVDCKVQEVFNGTMKTSVTVENSGNISAYIRLRVVTYWQDSKGNVIGRTSPQLKFGTEWKYNTDAWIYDSNDQTFYYKDPVAVGGVTAELLDLQGKFQGISLEPDHTEVNGVAFDYYPVIEFIAEAIQSEPGGTNSPVTKWKVTLDANGKITGVN